MTVWGALTNFQGYVWGALTDGFDWIFCRAKKEGNEFTVEVEDKVFELFRSNFTKGGTESSSACLTRIFHAIYPDIETVDVDCLKTVVNDIDMEASKKEHLYKESKNYSIIIFANR